MYNIWLGVGVAVICLVLAPVLGFPWYAGILPALLFGVGAWFLGSRRTAAAVEVELAPVPQILGSLQNERDAATVEKKLAQVREILEGVVARHGKWQLFLAEQAQGQLGMLSYAQMKFDEALPRLQAGWTGDWTCQTALGCAYLRKGQLDEGFAALDKATEAAPKEASAWAIRAVMLTRNDRRDDALASLGKGLGQLPGNPVLVELQATIANKAPLDPKKLGEVWYMFWPEERMKELQAQAMSQGPNGGARPGFRGYQPPATARPGSKHAPRR